MDRRIRVILKIVHGVIGMAAGICGSAVFATKYGNLHAAVWAGISVFVALLYVQVNRSVFRDVHRMIKSRCFVMYMTIAGVFIVAGSVAMITYLAIGLSHKQKMSPKGNYVVVVWGFMTFKWALFLLLSAKKFHKQYSEMEGNEIVINEDDLNSAGD